MLQIKPYFDSIKYRLPGVQNRQSPFLFPPLFFLFWIKTGIRISVGEISKNHQLQAHLRSFPQYVAQHRQPNTLKNKTDGNQGRMAEPLVQPDHLWVPSSPSSSSTSDGMCNTFLTNCLKLSKFLSLNEFHCWSQKLNSKNLANPTYALHALSWINLHTLYSLYSFLFLWTFIFIGTPCSLSDWIMWYD